MLILAAVCVMSLPNTVNAQFKFGLVGGLNVSKVSYKDISATSKSRTGWYVGPKAQFTVPIVGIGLDVAAEYSQRDLNTEGKTKTYQSIEIPVNIRYQLGLNLAKVYVMTGPQFGFQVGSDTWSIKDPTNINTAKTFKLKKSNVSWNVGAGVVLFGHLEAGVGYNIALSKYAKLLSEDGSIKANTWQVQVAYMF